MNEFRVGNFQVQFSVHVGRYEGCVSYDFPAHSLKFDKISEASEQRGLYQGGRGLETRPGRGKDARELLET